MQLLLQLDKLSLHSYSLAFFILGSHITNDRRWRHSNAISTTTRSFRLRDTSCSNLERACSKGVATDSTPALQLLSLHDNHLVERGHPAVYQGELRLGIRLVVALLDDLHHWSLQHHWMVQPVVVQGRSSSLLVAEPEKRVDYAMDRLHYQRPTCHPRQAL
eukprot:SAG31_NODE_489_length_14938_cov_5.644113_7_plen_161_part_00